MYIEAYFKALQTYDDKHRTAKQMTRYKKMVEHLANVPPHPPMNLDDPNFKGPYYKFNRWAGWLWTDHDAHESMAEANFTLNPYVAGNVLFQSLLLVLVDIDGCFSAMACIF